LLALFLFGIEELGIQIEEPFGILPLEQLCDGSIEGVVMDMRDSYMKGHFGPLDNFSDRAGVVMPADRAFLESGSDELQFPASADASYSSGDYLSQTLR